jgi:hypothetical protein
MNKTTQKKTQRYVHIVLRGAQIMGVLTSAQSAQEFKNLKASKFISEIAQNSGLNWSESALKESCMWRIERHALD